MPKACTDCCQHTVRASYRQRRARTRQQKRAPPAENQPAPDERSQSPSATRSCELDRQHLPGATARNQCAMLHGTVQWHTCSRRLQCWRGNTLQQTSAAAEHDSSSRTAISPTSPACVVLCTIKGAARAAYWHASSSKGLRQNHTLTVPSWLALNKTKQQTLQAAIAFPSLFSSPCYSQNSRQ